MTWTSKMARGHLVLIGALLAGACSDAPGAGSRDAPFDPSPTTTARRAVSPEMRAHTGLSHLPEPSNTAELAALLKRHYPAQLRAQRIAGSALLDVHVDAEGRVVDVDVVKRPGTAGHQTHRAVLEDRTGTHVLEINDRPEFGAAAQAALRQTRFQPALRDGKPVAYKVRMTVQFAPESES
ncbi:MAG: TonB family protein [Gemmatimonadetes bacterium]|nr:TonB family protein [Gemmatimonadota bacterium]